MPRVQVAMGIMEFMSLVNVPQTCDYCGETDRRDLAKCSVHGRRFCPACRCPECGVEASEKLRQRRRRPELPDDDVEIADDR